MVVPDHAAAALQPLEIDALRDVAADPHQEDQHDAEGEREAQIIVRVFRPFRPGGEGLRAHQRQQQRPAEGDVEPGQREDDEAGRRHPMHEPFERIEAHDRAPRASALDADHAARQIEDDEHRQHPEDRDAADPAQRHLVEMAPVAAGRLLERVGFRIGNAAEAPDRLELLQQLLLADRACLSDRPTVGCCAVAGMRTAVNARNARAPTTLRSLRDKRRMPFPPSSISCRCVSRVIGALDAMVSR